MAEIPAIFLERHPYVLESIKQNSQSIDNILLSSGAAGIELEYAKSVLEVFDSFVRPGRRLDTRLFNEDSQTPNIGVELISQRLRQEPFLPKGILSGDWISLDGEICRLMPCNGGPVKVVNGGRVYGVKGMSRIGDCLEEAEKGLEQHLKALSFPTLPNHLVQLISNVIEGDVFYQEKGIGYLKCPEGRFVYLLLQPFVLFEPRNQKYYGFGECKVALEFSSPRGFTEIPKVLNPYTHPCLRHAGLPFQPICYSGTQKSREEFLGVLHNPNLSLGQIASRLLNMMAAMLTQQYESHGREFRNIFLYAADYAEVNNPKKEKVGNMQKCIRSRRG